MTREELDFAIFCVESISEALKLNGAETYVLLNEKSDLLDEYIIKHYDVLHTQSKGYIVEELLDIMKKEGLIS